MVGYRYGCYWHNEGWLREKQSFVGMKSLLKRFRQEFYSIGGRDAKESRLNLLKAMANIKIYTKCKSRYSPKKTRSQYNYLKKSKFRKKSMNVDRPCSVCQSKATEIHHVIQIQHGGRNDKRNLVPICNDCHCKIHPWMETND